MTSEERNQVRPFIIVGAGAAGTAAAKCFAAADLASHTLLLEQHSEPGGSAGYFSRGMPKRTFDAGATQLIECERGQIQNIIYSLAASENQPSPEELFERIPTITQHWEDGGIKIILHADGRVSWNGPRQPDAHEAAEMKRLEKFISACHAEAGWMWSLLRQIPRFPLQSVTDVARALVVFLQVPFFKKCTFPFLWLLSCRQMMAFYGIKKGSLADDVLSGLLVDTTQNTPEKSPWLASAMGISILRRGIFRCRKGMRSYFRPMLSSFIERGGTYKPHHAVRRIETVASGFRVTFEDTKNRTTTTVETDKSILLNLTLADMTGGLVPEKDPLRETRVFRRWTHIAAGEKCWGAFALYALVEDKPEWPDTPHYHQMFARQSDPSELQSSLYVSIPARNDPAQPAGFRILTATIHLNSTIVSPQQRALWQEILSSRIETNLAARLSHTESAVPETFARYTGRRAGLVGGFPLRFGNFLFFANPSTLRHPQIPGCKLILMGDNVFPGQGVVACCVSGVIAFERATKLT
ncbi:MAG: hypothetical protein RL189_1247, partial [Pseudomonadota bacterium]